MSEENHSDLPQASSEEVSQQDSPAVLENHTDGSEAVEELTVPSAPETEELPAWKKYWLRLRKYFPVLAFLGGFLWDSLTLGRVVTSTDLFMLGGYVALAYVCLLLLIIRVDERYLRPLTWVVQFCFGGLFSALVIFYFKSSGNLWTMLFVLGLVFLLIGNEWLQSRYSRMGIAWSLFTLTGTMFLNFAIPHWVHSVNFLWFILSTLLGFGLTALLWKLSGRSPLLLIAPGGVSLLLLSFWFMDLIPPVPMVMKQNIVCKGFEKVKGEYTCMEPSPSLLEQMGILKTRIYKSPEERLYVLSSVFAPSDVEADLEHRWQYRDTSAGEWVNAGVVPFHMTGGRQEGYRLYSRKENMKSGLWRVVTALQGGAVMGFTEFVIPEGHEPDGVRYMRTQLH